MYALIDTKIFYTYNLEIYPRTQPSSFSSCSNKPYVNKLVAPVSKRDPNATFDSWFNSYLVMLQLLNQDQLTSTGTMHKNKGEISKKIFASSQ